MRIALDDFGAVNSSLATLQRFPFDRMKIDKSYMLEPGGHAAHGRRSSAPWCSSAAASAVPICAEGVETAEQLAQLGQEGCQEAQGFLFGRPSSAAGIDRMLVAAAQPRDRAARQDPSPRA